MVAWTYIVNNVIHLYQATLKNDQLFASLVECFEQNTTGSLEDIDDDRSDEQAEYEIAEVSRKFRACLRYGAFSASTRQTVEKARLAYRQLWTILIIYVGWGILSAAF